MFNLGMTEAEVHLLPNDQRVLEHGWIAVQEIFDLPTITEAEIIERGIPDGDMYALFRGRLDGIPVSGRLVKTREDQDLVIDVRYNMLRLSRQQRIIEQKLGRLTMLPNGE